MQNEKYNLLDIICCYMYMKMIFDKIIDSKLKTPYFTYLKFLHYKTG